jgi:hypothetical protein
VDADRATGPIVLVLAQRLAGVVVVHDLRTVDAKTRWSGAQRAPLRPALPERDVW